jgi:hypothetical protein
VRMKVSSCAHGAGAGISGEAAVALFDTVRSVIDLQGSSVQPNIAGAGPARSDSAVLYRRRASGAMGDGKGARQPFSPCGRRRGPRETWGG